MSQGLIFSFFHRVIGLKTQLPGALETGELAKNSWEFLNFDQEIQLPGNDAQLLLYFRVLLPRS